VIFVLFGPTGSSTSNRRLNSVPPHRIIGPTSGQSRARALLNTLQGPGRDLFLALAYAVVSREWAARNRVCRLSRLSTVTTARTKTVDRGTG
jgi:hypothetical protein